MLARVPRRILGQAALFVVLLFTLTLPATAFATLLSLSDPLGDAVGDGSLAAPTTERFGVGAFDILSITVLDSETFTFRLELAGAQNRADDSAGTGAQAITEVYLDSEPGGAPALLPGSGMQLPNGGWEVAFQIIGERLRVFRPDEAGAPAGATRALNARLVREGNALLVTTSLETPRRFSLYGLVGSYDPFSENGWRSVSLEPAPWHFSSPTQTRPVLDIVADDPALQTRAISSGVLPEIRTSFQQGRWLLIAVIGALFALFGVVLRLFAPTRPGAYVVSPKAPSESATPPDPPIISYGAREAGERAQILRSIDFETLQRGGWLEPAERPYRLGGDKTDGDKSDGDKPNRADDALRTGTRTDAPSAPRETYPDAFQKFSESSD